MRPGPARRLHDDIPATISPPRIDLPAAAPGWVDPPGERWSASAWIAVRPGTGLGAAPGDNQLGGSQAGLRVAYMLDRRRRIALFARVTSPLSGKGREGAVGIDWQPTRAPVRVVAEQRFGLDGTKGGAGLGLVGGIDLPIATGFRLETYGQAGFVSRARLEPYADGAARATRDVARSGDLRIALGAGVWGAAQRDAQRLDVGPSAILSVRNVRLSLDWRQRVAGKARPGSGPTLTLGGDF